MKESDEFAQGLIGESRNNKESGPQEQGRTKTMIDSMFCLQEPEPENYSHEIIKDLLLVCNIFHHLVKGNHPFFKLRTLTYYLFM